MITVAKFHVNKNAYSIVITFEMYYSTQPKMIIKVMPQPHTGIATIATIQPAKCII